MARLTIEQLQRNIDVLDDGKFGPFSRAALLAHFSNPKAARLTDADFEKAASDLGVHPSYIRGVMKIEAKYGSFDTNGRPTILFERHKFRNNTVPPGKFNDTNPDLSGPPYGRGGYGLLSAQWGKLAAACALDPEAAFMACSWGAFQVMGEHAARLGYGSAYMMAHMLRESEAQHLETFVRYVKCFNLVKALQACRPGNPDSCRAFCQGYNGADYEQFFYHIKFARAIVT